MFLFSKLLALPVDLRKHIIQKINNVIPLFFSHSPAHKYYLTTDPITGSIYLSDTNSRRIYKIKSTTSVKDIVKNSEVLAGTGDQCLPFDDTRCGDGGKGTDATLTNPRGETASSPLAFLKGLFESSLFSHTGDCCALQF